MSWMCQCPRELPDAIPACGACLFERPTSPTPGASTSKCEECSSPTRPVQLTRGEDHVERCASCHIPYLKRRMEADPISPDDLAQCKQPIGQAIAHANEKWATKRR